MVTARSALLRRRVFHTVPFLLLAVSTLAAQRPAAAQVPFTGEHDLHRLVRVDPRLTPSPSTAPIEAVQGSLAPAVRDGWTAFRLGAGGEWRGFVDRQSGRLESAEGAGIPWIPGRGNTLAPARTPVDLAALERAARAFLPRVAGLMGVDPNELVLDRERSMQVAGHLWLVDFGLVRDGFPVEGAHVVFRVNNGNLVQLGVESLPAPDARVPAARLTREEALAALDAYVGGFESFDRFVDDGSLRVLPVAAAPGTGPGAGSGKGLALATVWQLTFQRPRVTGTFRARVDAVTGEVLELVDVNRYAEATGGVYPVSPAAGPEVELPMPFADLSTGGSADSAGTYPFSPGSAPVTSRLAGPYVRISDTCGQIELVSDGLGHLDFGSSPGTDCATPGVGGAGNTHAARSLFYHVNRAAEAARGWLPGNFWLQIQLSTNANFFDVCNAFWDGFSINFFRSGSGCGNTGEIAAVAVHEHGHGLDQNDGNGFSLDMGTGEAYADFAAALATRDSCMGPGFRSTPCTGFGDSCTECTGVRDIDWAKHASNTPHTVENFTRLHCSPDFYAGPCGRQGHCESQVATEALWDLVARDLPSPGSRSAWTTVERLWYLSRPISTRAFDCDTTSSPWLSSGCVSGSLWRALRVVDDDDGNLANGTPNSCHLFAAFDRHSIACPSDPAANVCFSACTPPPAPAVTATGGNGAVDLAWSASPGATYDVYRGEAGCDGRLIKIADNVAGGAFTDQGVANGREYAYQLVAQAAGNSACVAAPSDCAAATPAAPPCTPPATPTGVTAQATATARITVAWQPVPEALGYAVQRSTTAGGPYQTLATVAAPQTSHVDEGLILGTTYYYVVRAFTTCESAPSAEVSATAVEVTCALHTVLYANDFEATSGLAGWSRGSFSFGGSVQDWRGVQACPAQSGSKIFRFGGPGCDDVYADAQFNFVRPPDAVLPANANNARLSFWHRRDFESFFDGGTLALALDGDSYVPVPAAAIVSGASYDNVLSGSCSSGAGGLPSFSGFAPQLVKTVVDLDAACEAAGAASGCGGHTLRIAFVTATDCSVQRTGWYLDDVAVTACVEPPQPLAFYTVTPCRLVDTRNPDGPALQAGALRTFALTGACGVPPTAKALSLNLTVTEPSAGGHLTLFPAGEPEPATSSISFGSGQTRANNAVLKLSGAGAVDVRAATAGAVHLIVDVNGYFE